MKLSEVILWSSDDNSMIMDDYHIHIVYHGTSENTLEKPLCMSEKKRKKKIRIVIPWYVRGRGGMFLDGRICYGKRVRLQLNNLIYRCICTKYKKYKEIILVKRFLQHDKLEKKY